MALVAADTFETADSTEGLGSYVGGPDIPVHLGDASSFLQNPEEGHRLISSFLSISQPSLRKAVVELVAALSAIVGDRR